jgi:hypothetical protein
MRNRVLDDIVSEEEVIGDEVLVRQDVAAQQRVHLHHLLHRERNAVTKGPLDRGETR